MPKLSLFVVPLLLVALSACSGSDRAGGMQTGPLEPEQVVVVASRGAVIAKNLCASCHGADFAGGTASDVTCPSLQVVRNLSLGEFDALLAEGTDPEGQAVNALMAVTRELSIEDRHAVHEYLHWWYEQ